MDYYVGLDLGQMRDHTAIAIVTLNDLCKKINDLLEMISRSGHRIVSYDEIPEPIYEVRHLERLPLGTRYPEVVERVRKLLDTPPLQKNSILAVDATGVGTAVVDMLGRAGLCFERVIITAGEKETHEGNTYRVPKRDLIATAQVLLQTRRLKIAPALPEAEILAEELLNFRYEITRAGNDVYGAWREGDHDDLVLAVALATWLVRGCPPQVDLGYSGPGVYTGNVFPPLRELPFPPLTHPPF